MPIEIKERDSVVIISINEEIFGNDIVDNLRKCILDKIKDGTSKIILDMEYIQQIRSVGLGLIISALKSLTIEGGQLKLINLNDNGKQLFEVCRLDQRIDIFDSEEEAIKSFK